MPDVELEAPEVEEQQPTPKRSRNGKSFPKPRKKIVPAAELFAYWSSIPKEIRDDRIILYAYRLLPVVDVMQALTEEERREVRAKRRKEPEKNCGKFTEPPDPEAWNQWIVDLMGAGDYSFRLNDQHPSIKGTICFASTSGEGQLRNWDSYPPDLDHKTVVLSDPANESYLRWARLRGIRFPGEPSTPFDEEQQEDDMANAQVIEKLIDKNNELAGRLADKPAEQKPSASPDTSAAAAAKNTEVMGNAAIQAQSIIIDAVKAAREIEAKQNDPGTALQIVTAVVDAMKSVRQEPAHASGGNDSILMQMLQQSEDRAKRDAESSERRANERVESERKHNEAMLAMMKDELAATRREISDLRNPKQPQVAPEVIPGLPGSSIIGKMFSNWLQETLSNKAAEAAAPELPWPAQLATELGPKLLETLGRFADAWGASKAQQSPVNPQSPPAPGQPAAALPPPRVKTQEEEMFENVFRQLEQPILQTMQRGARGYNLAGMILAEPEVEIGKMKFPGTQVYAFIAQLGSDGIARALKEYAPGLYQQMIQRFTPAKTQEFIDDFLNQAEAHQVAAEIKAQQQAPPAKPNGAASAVIDATTGKRVSVSRPAPTVTPKPPAA